MPASPGAPADACEGHQPRTAETPLHPENYASESSPDCPSAQMGNQCISVVLGGLVCYLAKANSYNSSEALNENKSSSFMWTAS